jgi:hypothetical protein
MMVAVRVKRGNSRVRWGKDGVWKFLFDIWMYGGNCTGLGILLNTPFELLAGE